MQDRISLFLVKENIHKEELGILQREHENYENNYLNHPISSCIA